MDLESVKSKLKKLFAVAENDASAYRKQIAAARATNKVGETGAPTR